jgi:hypothetical protein
MKGKIRIRIKGHLSENWKDWFDGMDIIYDGADMILYGNIKDQAFMYGILNRIRDLNLELISVNPDETND